MKEFDFVRIIKALDQLSSCIVNSTGFLVDDDKTKVITELLKKSNSLLKSQSLLLENYQVAECAILYRIHLERYVFLKDIVNNNAYSEFIRWSDSEQLKLIEKVISTQHDDGIKIPPINKKNLNRITDQKFRWDELSLYDYFKVLKLKSLYKYHYNFASSLVHTRVNQDNSSFLILNETSDYYKIDYWSLIYTAIQLHLEVIQVAIAECFPELCVMFNFYTTQTQLFVEGKMNAHSFEHKTKGILGTITNFIK